MAIHPSAPVLDPFPAAPVRPWGLLLDVAPRITGPNRWPLGIKFQANSYDPLFANNVDCVPSGLDSGRGAFPDVQEQTAFSLYDAVRCSTLSKTFDEMSELIDRRWRVVVSNAYAHQLLTGEALDGGNSFQGYSVALPASSTVLAAISNMEAVLAQDLRGGQGLIHLPPSLLTYAVTNGTVNLKGGTYYSPSGHKVVADSGFEDPSWPISSTATAYASGSVYWLATDRKPLSGIAHENTDFSKNTVDAIEESYGMLVYDYAKVWSTVVTKA